ncbi:MAG: flagellar hook-basal body complex protein [Candidatus Gastranaerophilales bacterium]|nr:flagellar hook-basal body complex protein [Candidatus Gastranaerophilales bacterium]
MSQGLYTAIGGISTAQSKIDVISNNIANMNTVAFKSSDINFQNVFSSTLSSGTAPTTDMGGTNPLQVGLGVEISDVTQNFTSGTVQSTGKSSDLNIQGNGFFAVQNADGAIMLTRAGNFTLDSRGNMITADGLKVIGTDRVLSTEASTETVLIPPSLKMDYTGDDQLASMNVVDSNSSDITSGTFSVNVTYVTDSSTTPATTATVSKEFTIDNTATYQEMADMVNGYFAGTSAAGIADGMDADPAKLTLEICPTGITLDDGSIPNYNGQLVFKTDSSGDGGITSFSLTGGSSNFVSESQISTTVGDTASTSTYYTSKTLSYEATIQPPDTASTAKVMSSYSVGTDGSIEVTYSNGDKLTVVTAENGVEKELLYKTSTGVYISQDKISVLGSVIDPANLQIQMATVVNNNGLISEGGNLFSVGPNSGQLTFSTGNTNGFGQVSSGGLESSNVDLPTQFAEMIIAQRSVDANSQTFRAINQILTKITQLGR